MKFKLKILFIIAILFLFEITINGSQIFKIKNINIYKFIKEKIFFEKLELANSLIKIYSELYGYAYNGYHRPKFSKKIVNYSSNQKYYNICICSIGKNENLYIREFVEYYHKLGVDKIFIYDNNDSEGEYFNDLLSNYIKDKFVEIIDVRGLSSIQIPIYNYCYQKNNDIYDWIGFLDFDEYLYIGSNKTVKNFFNNKKFDKCQTIFFNWIVFGDNNLIKYDNRILLDRFKSPSIKSPEGKSFVRGKIKNLVIPTTHIPGINKFIQKIFIAISFQRNLMLISNIFIPKPLKNFVIK